MNFYEILKSIYSKKISWSLNNFNDWGLCIALTKSLSKDPDNLEALKKIVQYMFFVSPRQYFYLLFFIIPKKNFVPKMIKTKKIPIKIKGLEEKIQDFFGWSSKELMLNMEFLKFDKKEEKLLKIQFGV